MVKWLGAVRWKAGRSAASQVGTGTQHSTRMAEQGRVTEAMLADTNPYTIWRQLAKCPRQRESSWVSRRERGFVEAQWSTVQ